MLSKIQFSSGLTVCCSPPPHPHHCRAGRCSVRAKMAATTSSGGRAHEGRCFGSGSPWLSKHPSVCSPRASSLQTSLPCAPAPRKCPGGRNTQFPVYKMNTSALWSPFWSHPQQSFVLTCLVRAELVLYSALLEHSLPVLIDAVDYGEETRQPPLWGTQCFRSWPGDASAQLSE